MGMNEVYYMEKTIESDRLPGGNDPAAESGAPERCKEMDGMKNESKQLVFIKRI